MSNLLDDGLIRSILSGLLYLELLELLLRLLLTGLELVQLLLLLLLLLLGRFDLLLRLLVSRSSSRDESVNKMVGESSESSVDVPTLGETLFFVPSLGSGEWGEVVAEGEGVRRSVRLLLVSGRSAGGPSDAGESSMTSDGAVSVDGDTSETSFRSSSGSGEADLNRVRVSTLGDELLEQSNSSATSVPDEVFDGLDDFGESGGSTGSSVSRLNGWSRETKRLEGILRTASGTSELLVRS
jgi:hypothetical protein